jgi:DNA-binding IscR family transcriptional regulator
MSIRSEAFDGKTYNHWEDYSRLKSSLGKVKHLMTHPYGRWWTLFELATRIGSSESGVSARIRDLRKEKNGSHIVESVRGDGGLWRYRVHQNF